MRRGNPLRAALAALLALGVVACLAPRPADAAGKISIQLTQISAKNDGKPGPKEIDPALAELKAELEKFEDYRVFKSLGSEKKDVAEGEVASFKLSEKDFTLRVTPASSGKFIALDPLEIKDEKGKEILSARLKVKDGGTGFVNKELESRDGRLLLAFTVKKS